MLKWLLRRRQELRTQLAASASAPEPEPEPAAAPAVSPGAPAPAADETPDELVRRAFPLHQGGDVATAEALYRRILVLDPRYADAHYLLGRVAQDRGQYETAIGHVREAIRWNDRDVHFHRTLGELHFRLGQWQESVTHYSDAARLEPNDLDAWNNLGCAYQKLGRLAEATRCFEQAAAISQDSPGAVNNVALSLQDRGRIEEAIPGFRRAHALGPDDLPILGNYLYSLNFSPRVTQEEAFRAHLEFDERWGTGRHGRRARPITDPDPERRLRIAYFSPDLRSHPVAMFLEPVLVHRDRAAFEVFGYHLYPLEDRVTARLKTRVDHWVDCRGLSDEQIAARIEADGIDIVVDLAGHTGDNRLAVLGLKPAPVIATWLGYPNTTGLRTVDYKLTDAICDPPGATEQYHTEQLVRLPRQWCYSVPDTPTPQSPLPALRKGRVRFGSFNNASKLAVGMIHLWGEMLRRMPEAEILVWGVVEEHAQAIRDILAAEGADPARASFSDRTSFPKQVAMYPDIDIALDTFPYSGVTTTFNSLWMGVPMIGLAGATSASRSTLSILSGLGLQDWVARTEEEYVDIALRKAADLPALAALRAGLRERLQASPFMDAPGFTRELERAFRGMWRERCRTARGA
jgi:protein O-GlcNAc transferase